MNKKSINCVIVIFLLVTLQLTSQVLPELPTWHIDQDIKIDFKLNSEKIWIGIRNVGSSDRKITSNILDPNYIKLILMRVSFINYESPRREREEFSLAADGVVGSTSEIFKVKTVNLAPGEVATVEINYREDLDLVKNKKLEKYLATDGSAFRLSFKMDLNSVGFTNDCALVYVFPEMNNVSH